MPSLPFAFDFSNMARLIRRIGTSRSTRADLETLLHMLEGEGGGIRFEYLWQIWHRSEAALAAGANDDDRELLDTLMRSARFEAQSQARA